MAIEVKIPAVGESISSGVVSVWHKKSGDFVNAGDALFTLETDKVSTEIAAETSGVLDAIVPEGQEEKIGEVVATIDDSKKPIETAPEKTSVGDAVSVSGKPTASPAKEKSADAKTLSPAVRRIVDEEHLEPEKISGTGKSGRLTKADALAAAQNRGASEEKVEPPSRGYGGPSIAEDRSAKGGNRRGEQSADGRFVRKKISSLRSKIAAQLEMEQRNAEILWIINT